jgi:hypothetical protein
MENPFNEQENKMPLGKFTLIYGSITGIILIMVSLIFYIIDVDPSSFLNYINIALLIAAMSYSIVQFRKTQEGGFISYGRSLGCGFLTGMFASILLALYTFILFKYIDPGMIDKILAGAEDKMLEQNPNMTDEQLEMAMKYSSAFMSPIAMLILTIIGMSFWSLIISLIISIFTRKVDKSIQISEIH